MMIPNPYYEYWRGWNACIYLNLIDTLVIRLISVPDTRTPPCSLTKGQLSCWLCFLRLWPSLTCFLQQWSWLMIKLELSTCMQPEMTPITSSGGWDCFQRHLYVNLFLFTWIEKYRLNLEIICHTCSCLSVSSSGRHPWTARGSHTSWSTQCYVDLRGIPAEILSSRCSTGPCPHSWMHSQVQNS